jgi:hypothetical protein
MHQINEGPTRAAASFIAQDIAYYDAIILSRGKTFFRAMGWGALPDPPCLVGKRASSGVEKKGSVDDASPSRHTEKRMDVAIGGDNKVCLFVLHGLILTQPTTY